MPFLSVLAMVGCSSFMFLIVVAASLVVAWAPRVADGDDISIGGTSSGAAPDHSASLSVVFSGVGVVIKLCKLCGAKSSDESPLPNAHEEDEWSGRIPWDHYVRVSDLEEMQWQSVSLLPIHVRVGQFC